MKDLKIFFFIKKDKKNTDGLRPIYGKITYLDSSITYSTGISISVTDWKKTRQLSKPKTQEEEDMHKKITRQKNDIKKIKALLEDTEKAISASIIKDILLGKDKKKRKEDIA